MRRRGVLANAETGWDGISSKKPGSPEAREADRRAKCNAVHFHMVFGVSGHGRVMLVY